MKNKPKTRTDRVSPPPAPTHKDDFDIKKSLIKLKNIEKAGILSLALRSINFQAGNLEALAIVEIMELINKYGDEISLKQITKIETDYINGKQNPRQSTPKTERKN